MVCLKKLDSLSALERDQEEMVRAYKIVQEDLVKVIRTLPMKGIENQRAPLHMQTKRLVYSFEANLKDSNISPVWVSFVWPIYKTLTPSVVMQCDQANLSMQSDQIVFEFVLSVFLEKWSSFSRLSGNDPSWKLQVSQLFLLMKSLNQMAFVLELDKSAEHLQKFYTHLRSLNPSCFEPTQREILNQLAIRNYLTNDSPAYYLDPYLLPFEIIDIGELIQSKSNNACLRVHGGAVRTLVMARLARQTTQNSTSNRPLFKIRDFDFKTNLDEERLLTILKEKYPGAHVRGKAHPIVVITLATGEECEFTTGQSKASLTKAQGDTTLNSASMDVYTGGVIANAEFYNHMREKTIALVNNNIIDPIVALRAVRFATRFDYPIQEQSVAVIKAVKLEDIVYFPPLSRPISPEFKI